MASLRPASAREASTEVFWAFAAVVVISLLTITLSNRGPVRVLGAVVLAGLLVFGLVYRLGRDATPDVEGVRGRPSAPAASIAAIPFDVIEVDELKLTGSGGPFELRGVVKNAAQDRRVRSVTLRIVRRDCFEGALDPSGCAVVWQDRHWITVNVPPESERKFATSFYAHTTVPRPRGTIKDEFTLIAATGEAIEP